MKRLLFGLILVAGGVFTIVYCSQVEKDAENEYELQMSKAFDEHLLSDKVRSLVNNAKTLQEIETAEMLVQTIPDKNEVAPILALKKSTIIFNEAEDYLRKAIEIERAATLPPEPPPMPPATNEAGEVIPPPQPQPRELHPLTLANLNKATALYEKARKEMEKVKDTGDANFDYHMNYLKGEIYYRLLELVADQESAPELFNQTLTYYKYALRNRNNDINTVINIEILIKNQNDLTGGNNQPQARKRQMLNSKKYGVGKSSGN